MACGTVFSEPHIVHIQFSILKFFVKIRRYVIFERLNCLGSFSAKFSRTPAMIAAERLIQTRTFTSANDPVNYNLWKTYKIVCDMHFFNAYFLIFLMTVNGWQRLALSNIEKKYEIILRSANFLAKTICALSLVKFGVNHFVWLCGDVGTADTNLVSRAQTQISTNGSHRVKPKEFLFGRYKHSHTNTKICLDNASDTVISRCVPAFWLSNAPEERVQAARWLLSTQSLRIQSTEFLTCSF